MAGNSKIALEVLSLHGKEHADLPPSHQA
jgi:hypothetical protein